MVVRCREVRLADEVSKFGAGIHGVRRMVGGSLLTPTESRRGGESFLLVNYFGKVIS
jgi:hypothetical protein